MKTYPQLVASRRETEEKEGKKEEEEQEEETEIPIATTTTTTSTSNIAAGTRTNAVRLQSPSWSWFRDETEDATNITRPPLVSRRNASLSAKKKEVDTAPPYATSADLLASNLLVVAQHEKNITLLSSERDQLLQLLATKFSNGAGKSMKERERKRSVEDQLKRVEENLKRAKAALKTARRSRKWPTRRRHGGGGPPFFRGRRRPSLSHPAVPLLQLHLHT